MVGKYKGQKVAKAHNSWGKGSPAMAVTKRKRKLFML